MLAMRKWNEKFESKSRLSDGTHLISIFVSIVAGPGQRPGNLLVGDISNLKSVRIGTSCDSNIDIFFVHQKSVVDAAVNIFNAFIGAKWDRIECSEDRKIVFLAVRKTDSQERNLVGRTLMPREGWKGCLA